MLHGEFERRFLLSRFSCRHFHGKHNFLYYGSYLDFSGHLVQGKTTGLEAYQVIMSHDVDALYQRCLLGKWIYSNITHQRITSSGER